MEFKASLICIGGSGLPGLHRDPALKQSRLFIHFLADIRFVLEEFAFTEQMTM